ncbi:hypothetical protein EGR_09096 [Echinococcus granulosus]|uniref:Uncharacterized protein n=1 Tax=Echinococcus granulosus TaxID=6210 RepID=W6U4J6_ECHGR|nr:hypothetical protein EGR_09096 [Echinococcus granulosus]EUB56058.1 hypothetical protein EGR_09096 [Echinococcus granulosus]
MELLEHIYGNHRSDYWPIRNTEILPNNVPNRLVYEIYHVLHVASVDDNRMNFGDKFPYADYAFGNSSEQSSDLNKQQRERTSNSEANTRCLNPDLLNAISSAETPPEAQQEDLLHTPDKHQEEGFERKQLPMMAHLSLFTV